MSAVQRCQDCGVAGARGVMSENDGTRGDLKALCGVAGRCLNGWCWPSTRESVRWFVGGLVIAMAMGAVLMLA
ncbi:MAG: hypothetical protein ACTS3F_01475 [Phycisphaerales bacterium]